MHTSDGATAVCRDCGQRYLAEEIRRCAGCDREVCRACFVASAHDGCHDDGEDTLLEDPPQPAIQVALEEVRNADRNS